MRRAHVSARALSTQFNEWRGDTSQEGPIYHRVQLLYYRAIHAMTSPGMQRHVKFILAPPGCGKTTFLSLTRNPFFKPEWWKLSCAPDSLRDADDILSSVQDHCSGGTLLKAGQHYMGAPELGWDKWHRVCFRALIKYQHENGEVGPILCGFMVGGNFEAVQSGFDKFVGEGMPVGW